jgi:Ca-activated chloride channel family protein
MKIELKSAEPLASIYSPSHKVEIKRDGPNHAVIGYESKDEKPDTDFQLVYSSDTRDVGLRLITYKPDGDDGYFLLLAAPTVSDETKPAAKDVVFVVDTSGSMAGAKLQQAQKALRFCVENLNGDDRFEIVRFSTEAEPLPRVGTSGLRSSQACKRFHRRLQANRRHRHCGRAAKCSQGPTG